MKTPQQLFKIREDMNRTMRAVSFARAEYGAHAKEIEADTTRHPDYIRDRVGQARNEALAQLGTPLNELRSLNSVVQGERTYWQQTQFVLSRQRFHDDDALENTTRNRHFAELSAMPAGLLRMTFEHAKAEGNLPLLFQCYLADTARDLRVVDLRGIEIPEQKEALKIISECAVFPVEADILVSEISGRRKNADNVISEARSRIAKEIEPVLTFKEAAPAEKMPAEESPERAAHAASWAARVGKPVEEVAA